MNEILNGEATLEELYELNEKKGYEFIVEDGKITGVIY